MRLLVIVATAALLLAVSCSSSPPAVEVLESPNDGVQHVPVGFPHAAYSTIPATSGPHWSTLPAAGAPHGAPARWGIYTDVLPDEVLVHNLEHGGIGLHYNCPNGCPEIVSALGGLVPAGASQFIVSPYSGAPAKVAVTAWRRLLLLDKVDTDQIKAFIKAYQDRAPESVKGDLF